MRETCERQPALQSGRVRPTLLVEACIPGSHKTCIADRVCRSKLIPQVVFFGTRYLVCKKQHRLTVSRINRRNSALSDALHHTPTYKMGDWVWIYYLASTITQGPKVKLSLNWTGPFKILEVGPAASAPDKRRLADKVLLYLNLPSDMPGASAKPRVTVERCKPCTGHTMPTARSFHQLDYRALCPQQTPQQVTSLPVLDSDVRIEDQRLEVEKITGHQSVRARGGIIAVLYETHWKGLLRTS